uniref:Uncharacterized protein n=1 Tax=viral metagenome TaxID=1070528 RepID=A0A6C0AEJ9_9ZZZZ
MKYIYFSGQQTVKSGEFCKNILENEPDSLLFVSAPNFNLPKNEKQVETWKDIPKIDVNEPCYGTIVESSAIFAEKYGYIVERSVSNFVLEKAIKCSVALLKALEQFGHINALNKLKSYVDGLNDILNMKVHINNKDEWHKFLISYGLNPQMELNLDKYLCNFDELSTDQIEEVYSYSTELKDKTRWLTKVGYYPNGCYTDVRNLIEILKLNKQTLPYIYIMDGENDDLASLKILQFLHSQSQSNMKVYLQLPLELESNNEALNIISKKLISSNTVDYEIFFDSESANMKVLKVFYKF